MFTAVMCLIDSQNATERSVGGDSMKQTLRKGIANDIYKAQLKKAGKK